MRFRSPLLSQSRFLYFPSGTEMVHFPEFARTRLCIHRAVLRFYRSGFPHSDIPESKPACGSSRLIAACHVLHRHLLPRHPPCALSNLTIKFTQSTSAASGRMFNFRYQACAWLRLLTINCQRNSMTYASVHRELALIRGFRGKAASPSQIVSRG